jgi:hypothetical protein
MDLSRRASSKPDPAPGPGPIGRSEMNRERRTGHLLASDSDRNRLSLSNEQRRLHPSSEAQAEAEPCQTNCTSQSPARARLPSSQGNPDADSPARRQIPVTGTGIGVNAFLATLESLTGAQSLFPCRSPLQLAMQSIQTPRRAHTTWNGNP